MKSSQLLAVAWLATMPLVATAAESGVQGEPEAVRAAQRMIEQVGGDVWATSRSFTVRERAYLASGEVAELTIRRDLVEVTRWMRATAETFTFEEVIGSVSGWRGRDGQANPYTDAELTAERRGLEQSPYYVYHRLASGDARLTVEWLESERRLNVYEDEDRLLCWFFVDAVGAPISWANVYKDRENRHNYGPLIALGGAGFPKWGTAADASWRFEYLDAELSDRPAPMPRQPGR